MERTDADADTALMELLEETALFERVSHTIVDGQLYIPPVYR